MVEPHAPAASNRNRNRGSLRLQQPNITQQQHPNPHPLPMDMDASVSGPLHTAPGTALLYDAPRGRRRRQPTQAEKVCICLVALAFLYYSFAGGVAVPGGSTSTLWGCLTNSHGCWESSIKAGRWYSLPDRTVLVNRSDTAKVLHRESQLDSTQPCRSS